MNNKFDQKEIDLAQPLQLAMVARLLGAYFYYSPTSDITRPIEHALFELDKLIDWPNPSLVQTQCQQLTEQYADPKLTYQFSVLFEGQGKMIAPPWGSVYLDKEQLLRGDCEARYGLFLKQQGLVLDTGINEPQDQFGLMLMAFAALIEQNQIEAAKQLIDQHLINWAPSYLTKLIDNPVSQFYRALAIIAREYLNIVCQRFLHLDMKHV